MQSKKLILSISILIFCVSVSAENLEEFLKRAVLSDIESRMFHDKGRYMQIVGNQQYVLDKPQLMQLVQQTKAIGTTTEISEFQILNKFENENIVSVVFKTKVKQSVGNSQINSEVISHEILMKENDRYISVFSVGMQ